MAMDVLIVGGAYCDWMSSYVCWANNGRQKIFKSDLDAVWRCFLRCHMLCGVCRRISAFAWGFFDVTDWVCWEFSLGGICSEKGYSSSQDSNLLDRLSDERCYRGLAVRGNWMIGIFSIVSVGVLVGLSWV